MITTHALFFFFFFGPEPLKNLYEIALSKSAVEAAPRLQP